MKLSLRKSAALIILVVGYLLAGDDKHSDSVPELGGKPPKGAKAPKPRSREARAFASASVSAAENVRGSGTERVEGANAVVVREYRIAPGDVLQINVWKEPDLSSPSVVVRSDGKISLPLVKELDVLN